ncbi:unnamed protein product [Ilex paraguariensis]|uniref:Uncharacterized protein n=1 Tax=Ilex paraguariensis TaxID=185542 RepID=A0ABC8RLS6_9AQUA
MKEKEGESKNSGEGSAGSADGDGVMAQALEGFRSMLSGHNLGEANPRVSPTNLSDAMAKPRATPNSTGQRRGVDRPELTRDASGVDETGKEANERRLGGIVGKGDDDGGLGTSSNVENHASKFSGIFRRLGVGGCPSALGKAMETLGAGEDVVGSDANCRHKSGNHVCCLGGGGDSDGSLRLDESLRGRLGTWRMDSLHGRDRLGHRDPTWKGARANRGDTVDVRQASW